MNTPNLESSDLSNREWLAALVLRHPDRFLPRVTAALARWQTLSRGVRRRLQRRAAAGALVAALLAAMLAGPLLPTAHAATITVDGVACTLDDAIRAANTDSVSGFCASGTPGLDTIDLQADVTLTAVAGDYTGNTGLPAVTSEIVIEGNGHTIERDGAAPAFRILYVGATGDLTFNDVTISGGSLTTGGGGFYVRYGAMAINDSIISGNHAWIGGGGGNQGGVLRITNSVFRENKSTYGGGAIYHDQDDGNPVVVSTTITGSLFELNEAGGNGGAIYNDLGTLTISDTTFVNNEAAHYGGAIFSYYEKSLITITGSTLSDNYANYGGGIYSRNGTLTLINSTLSGNRATLSAGGGVFKKDGHLGLTNTTVTDNFAMQVGGGIFQNNSSASDTISRSIISGNTTGGGISHEIYIQNGTVTADEHNVFSDNSRTNFQAFIGFTPGASDFDASSDAGNVALTAILDTTLADNGGPTHTHNLVDNSPAVDFAPDADCVDPSPTDGLDQRGFVRPFDVVGQGNEGSDTCDAGAVEFGSSPATTSVFMSATTAGTTDDAVAFGPEDILEWNDGDWSLFFDGSAAGLNPTGKWKHNINAFHINGGDIVMSFTQNARFVPGITPKVDGMDLVRWNGHSFSLWFDGSDVDLNNKTQEKIDALHILPGSESPIGGGSCLAYLLISTQGPGRVSNPGEPAIKFGGEDVLGFCMTNPGSSTAGFWHLLLDGSAEGMPRNSTDSISVSDDGGTMYLTTRGAFDVDAAAGGHSMVYQYDFGTGTFSGPVFDAAAEGLPRTVDGLQVDGELP